MKPSKKSRLFAIGVVCLPLVLRSAAEETTIRFANGDRLAGNMEAVTKEDLVWKSPLLESPASFVLKSVLEVGMTPRIPDLTARHEASVSLTNGDLVRGQIASVSDTSVELDTWYAGRIKLNRLMVSEIKIAELPDFIYRGPAGMDGWKNTGERPAWTYQNSGLRSSGIGLVSRTLPNLPDEFSLSFDVAWRNSLYLETGVFSSADPGGDRPSGGYVLTLQQRYASVRSGNGGRTIGVTSNLMALQENEKARIEIRVSRKSGKICLFVDGVMIDVWVDAETAKTTFDKGIHFNTKNNSPVRVSRIEVAAWDGEVDQLPEPKAPGGWRRFDIQDQGEQDPAPKVKDKAGRMELRNGDSISGEVQSINDGIITVKTPFREVKLPVESLRSLTLKPVPREEPKRENGDVRAWFADGSSLVFRLESATNGELTGYSQTFGTAVFKSEAFSRIEFNLYDQALEEIRLGNGM